MNPLTVLDLTVVGGEAPRPLRFPVRRVVNAGYVGRDQKAVRAHVEELAREGIPPPRTVPMVFPFLTANLTTADRIEVIGGRTSGEVEYVLLLQGNDAYVGVGSDHTDRDLERQDMVKSKQICANVLAREVWRLQDVRDRWDDLMLRGWVRPTIGTSEILYQQAPLRSILSPDALLELLRSRLLDRQEDGLVVFSGTIPLLDGHTIFGEAFRVELEDAKGGRRLGCAYRVERLVYLPGE